MSSGRGVDQAALSAALVQFAETVSGEFDASAILRQLASAAVPVLGVDGAGVMVAQRHGLLGFAHATGLQGEPVAHLERLQAELGDGPCRESHRDGRLLNIEDLFAQTRWPAYVAQARKVGLRSVCAVPLRARDRGWGVLDLYRADPGGLDPAEVAAARTLGHVATSYLVITADRDAARAAQVEMAHRAMHDVLTGLPVRWVFLDQLGHALARLARSSRQVAVMFLDVDGLKYVNDTYGHRAGDRLLTTFVQRVRAGLRPSDVMARLGGDEFVVLLEDLMGARDATRIAERILDQLARPYRVDGHTIRPSASIGLALTADPASTPDALIAHADAAMYQAKRAGRARFEVFDQAHYAQDRRDSASRQDLLHALRRAAAQGQLELHYQPIIDLTGQERPPSAPGPDAAGEADPRGGGRLVADLRPGRRLHAAEALLRWRHPERGLLPAAAFLPEAERAGLSVELGAWVLRAACEQLAVWDRHLGERSPRRLFVNISVAELLDPRLCEHLAECLHLSGVTADRLVLEITETGLIDNCDDATAAATELRDLGCELAIDDFGTGHSSLSRLVQVPAATVKVDRSFAQDLLSNPEAAAVITAVLTLGRSLRRDVIVEGVEDETTLTALHDLGVILAQGYHLGRPIPPHQFAQQVEQRPSHIGIGRGDTQHMETALTDH